MKIAPIDIAHKTFARKVMGLDPDEVMDFMRDVADQMEEVIRERNALKEAMRQKEMTLMDYKERDETLKSTIQTAAKMSDGIRADAEREAKLIVGDAQQKSDMILKDSRDQLKRVYQEIADLKRLRMQFEVNLRTICQSHVSMIEQSHMAVPDPQINFAQAQSHMNTQPQSAAANANQGTAQQQFAARASSGGGQVGGPQVFQPAAGNLAQQGFAAAPGTPAGKA
jgi:cell division initiation protein